ncbi:MAG TPA: hypothetical protein VIH42_07220 [Thermoguttaceae bacterium]
MHAKQRPAVIRWLPAIVLGAAIVDLIYLWLVYRGKCVWFWYDALGYSFIGAVLGYFIIRNAFGMYNGLRAGKWIRFLFWGVIGALVGGTMGLLAKSSTPQDFAPILPDSWLMTWISWAAYGSIFAILGIGQDYRTLSPPKTSSPTAPAPERK